MFEKQGLIVHGFEAGQEKIEKKLGVIRKNNLESKLVEVSGHITFI